jgi:hypothetical protein
MAGIRASHRAFCVTPGGITSFCDVLMVGELAIMPVVPDRCMERLTLSYAVADAIRLTYKAKIELDAARQRKGSLQTDPFTHALAVARTNERNSQRALLEHIEKHHCSR